MTSILRLALIALMALTAIGCGDMFQRRPGERPEIGDAPSPLSGGQMWDDSPSREPMIYVVTSDDNSFYDIARRVYGDGSLSPLIEEANPDVDEDGLGSGQQIMIPALPAAGNEDDSTPEPPPACR